MSRIVRQGDALLAQAEPPFRALPLCPAEGLSGLEFAWGIPGSVGGAVRMNAGAYGGETKDVVTRVEALSPEGEPFETDAAGARFGYRTSRFAGGEIVCSAVFSLSSGNPEEIDAKMAETLRKRVEKQPLDYPSAGSAFKRPKEGYAAALIDSCGLKGFSVGGPE